MNWIRTQLDILEPYEPLLWWSFAISLTLVVLTPIIVAIVIVKLPKDYFTTENREPADWWNKHPRLRPIVVVAKNVLGAFLVLTGVAMLVAPGQGLLTLVAGLMLLNFPGKYRLERRLATQRHVWRSINWLRNRFGREPLERPEDE